MPNIDVNEFTLHYDDRGEGDPLLFLHGGSGIASDWNLVFADGDPSGFRLIVPEARGHGRSTNPSRAFTFRQAANDAFALLDHLHIQRVKAIGLSMGAKTLLHMATARPDRIEAMVIVSATPYFPAQARAAMAQLSVDQFSEADWEAQRKRHPQGDDQIRMLFEQMRDLKNHHDDMAFTPPLLATITARTLIVHGDRDPLYPVELALEMYRAIPASSLWVVPDGGHGPIFGAQARPFVTAAVDFLRAAAPNTHHTSRNTR